MRILLTGRNGQLGWELHRRLEQRHDVIALGRDDLDLRDARYLHDMLKRLPELALIVNCAAYTDVDRAEHEPLPAEQLNVEAPAVLAAEADRRSIPIIHFSTDYVFDGQRKGVASLFDATASACKSARDARRCPSVNHIEPYTEDDQPNPLGVYGWSKLAGEQRVRDLCDRHLIFRLSGLYGTRRRNFLTTMLRYLHQGETPRVVDDQFVSPNWCPMIAEAVEHVIARILHDTYRGYRRSTGAGCYADAVASNRVKAQPWGVYHLTGHGYTTWYEFARLIFEKTSQLWDKPLIVPQPVGTEEFGAVAKRPAYAVMNPEKFTQTFSDALPDWQTQFLHGMNSIPP
jgi:dTDP-4-dehydrorhamnose reductase